MNTMMQAFAKTRLSMAALLSVMLLAAATAPASGEVAIQKVTSESGVTAWLVENYSVPIIAINFAFEGGSAQDPAGKEGLADLMTGLFDEGAGDLDSEAFQVRLDDAGAEMRFNAGRDAVSGSMRMLAENKEEAFELLRLAVEQPRFDGAPIARIRGRVRLRLLIKAPKGVALQDAIRRWLAAVKIPSAVRVAIDIDPQSFL